MESETMGKEGGYSTICIILKMCMHLCVRVRACVTTFRSWFSPYTTLIQGTEL